jgi:hypothetical protein
MKCKTKPTGDAYCPPHTLEALRIDRLINEKVDTRDLNDSEFDDNLSDEAIEVSSDESDHDSKENPKIKIKDEPSSVKKEAQSGPIARRPLSDRLPAQVRQRRQPAQELMNSITSALSPAAQSARFEESAARSFQMSHIFSLNNRIRDLERANETLRQQLSDAERARDRAEIRLEFARASGAVPASSPRVTPAPLRRRVVQEVQYPEGGGSRQVYYVDDDMPEHEREEMQGFCDPENVMRVTLEDEIISSSPMPTTSADDGNNLACSDSLSH